MMTQSIAVLADGSTVIRNLDENTTVVRDSSWRIVMVVDARGQERTMRYDGDGNLISIETSYRTWERSPRCRLTLFDDGSFCAEGESDLGPGLCGQYQFAFLIDGTEVYADTALGYLIVGLPDGSQFALNLDFHPALAPSGVIATTPLPTGV